MPRTAMLIGLAVLLLTSSIGCARADVLTLYGGRQTDMAASIIHRNVPAEFWRVDQDVPISVVSHDSMLVLTQTQAAIGVYMDFPSIWVEDDLSPVDFTHTTIHEYGHFVWWRLMTARERSDYTMLWNGLTNAGLLPSDYAGTNVREGFAESFAAVYEMRRLHGGTIFEQMFMARLVRRLHPLEKTRSPLLLVPMLSHKLLVQHSTESTQ